MLSLKNVSSGYGGLVAIDGVSMHVRRGEAVVLIGANGAGKSTLLRTISGALKLKRGQILYQGRQINGIKPHTIAKMGLVQIPEGRGILSRMTVRENLEMGAFVRSDKKEIAKDLNQVFERFPRLKERLSQSAGTLSGGEQQMLAIGRALMAKPQLLLMDEPSLGLAPIFVEFVFEIINELCAKDDHTILLVEQNANQALAVADRGYVMETGRIVLEGASQTLRDNEGVKKAYLGKSSGVVHV